MSQANRIDSFLQSAQRDQVAMLQELVRIPSISGAEAKLQSVLKTHFESAGFETSIQPFTYSDVAGHLPDSADRSLDDRPNVIGRLQGLDQGRSLLLNGHVDTVPVPPSERWRHGPFSAEVEDGCLWGRGSADMKAGLVAAFFAVRAVQEADLRLDGDLVLAATVAEETGGAGTIAYLQAHSPLDAAIVMEPTGLRVCSAHAGASHAQIHIHGQSAHAGVRETGVNAAVLAARVFEFLYQYEADRNRVARHELFDESANNINLNIASVHAEAGGSTVPDLATLTIRMGFLPGESVALVKTDFAHQLASWASQDPWFREHPPTVEWLGSQFPPAETPATEPFIASMLRTAAGPKASTGLPFGTDMAHIRELWGVPAVVYGPGHIEAAHRNDEHVPLTELHESSHTLAMAALDWCGVPKQ